MKKKEAPKEAVKQEEVKTTVTGETIEAKDAEEIELEVVWEKEFDEPVVDVIFDETEMTVKEAKEFKLNKPERINNLNENIKIKVKYPKIVFIKDKDMGPYYGTLIKSIFFMDIHGRIVNQKKLKTMEVENKTVHNIENLKKRNPDTFEDVIILKESKIIGIMERIYHISKNEIRGINKVVFYNKNYEEIVEYKYEKGIDKIIFIEADISVKEARKLKIKGLEQKRETETVKIPYPKVLIVQDDNSNVGGLHIKSLRFLNNNGKLKKEIFLRQNNKNTLGTFSISENNRFVVITYITRKIQDDIYRGIVEAESIILSIDGDELWNTKHHLTQVEISPNGTYIIGNDIESNSTPIVIIYQGGKIIEINKHRRGWIQYYLQNGKYCALRVIVFDPKIKNGVEKDIAKLVLIDEKGNILWTKDNIVKGEAAIWTRLNKTTDNTIVLTVEMPESGNTLEQYKIFKFDIEGNIIKENDNKEK